MPRLAGGVGWARSMHLRIWQTDSERVKKSPTDPASNGVDLRAFGPRVGGRHDWQLPGWPESRTRPADPASVDVMIDSYQDGRNLKHAPPTPRRWT
jgi:hypothetical protein